MPSSQASDVSGLSDLNSEDILPPHSSDLEPEDDHDDHTDTLKPPPSKKRRITALAQSPQRPATPSSTAAAPVAEDLSDISSDTSGSCPPSPRAFKDLAIANDEYVIAAEHILVCQWEECPAGDLGNQDDLVKHMTDVHVPGSKDDDYACAWGDCRTRTKPQKSAYALRAHMRSHTKEKPFYCSLPECDRSFTRSDALTKHMRTVHENEMPRTLEHYARPLPRASATAANTPVPDPPASAPASDTKPEAVASQSKSGIKLKLNMNGKPKASPSILPATNSDSTFLEDIATAPLTPLSSQRKDEAFGPLPPEMAFTTQETALDRRELFRLLRRQIHWAELDGRDINAHAKQLEVDRRKEWLAKELVFENVLEAEYAAAERKGVFDEEGNDLTFGEPPEAMPWSEKVSEEKLQAMEKERLRILEALESDVAVAGRLPLGAGETPWYRGEDVLAQRRRRKEDGISRGGVRRYRDTAAGEMRDAIVITGDETEEEEI